jgi:hypothetical protein
MAEWIDTLAAKLNDRAARGTKASQPQGDEPTQAHPTEEYFLALVAAFRFYWQELAAQAPAGMHDAEINTSLSDILLATINGAAITFRLYRGPSKDGPKLLMAELGKAEASQETLRDFEAPAGTLAQHYLARLVEAAIK